MYVTLAKMKETLEKQFDTLSERLETETNPLMIKDLTETLVKVGDLLFRISLEIDS